MSKSKSHSIGVIGAGSWGTALSCLMADDNPAIYLWAYERETVKDITNNRENADELSRHTKKKIFVIPHHSVNFNNEK